MKNKGFSRVIPIDWSPDKNINIKKVKAHPERREGVWEEDDRGIWTADLIAGGGGGIMEEVLATSVMKYYGSLGSIAIVDNNNVPYIGDLMRRCSKEKKRRYWERRNRYREDNGKTGIWEGCSSHMSYKMMGKSGSMEDNTAVNRIGLGKRWNMSRHNMEVCQACGEDSRSYNHVLRKCRHERLHSFRKRWHEDISKKIYKMKDRDLRGLMEDTWT